MKKRTWRTPLLMTGLAVLLVLALAAPALADRAPAGGGPASLAPPGTPSPLSAPSVTAQGNVLWEQGIDYTANWAIQYAPVYTQFIADDFTNTEPWTIGKIFLPVFIGANVPETFTFTWAIYADDGTGKPNGIPYDGVTTPFWSLTLDLSDPQVTGTGGDGQDKDLLLTLDTPITLPPGDWWLVPYATFTSDPGNYWVGWYSGTGSSRVGSVWTDPSEAGWVFDSEYDQSFRLEGEATSARTLKQEAAERLETARANSTARTQRNLLSLALSSLEASLSHCYWRDEHHLKELTGSLVFGYERTAVSLIRSAMRLGQLRSQADPLSEAIDLLVTADQVLAYTALDGARKAGGKSWLLPLAEKSLAKGDSYAAAGRPELAIEAYKAAWRYAVTGCERWTSPE